MRKILRTYLFYLGALWAIKELLQPSFTISGDIKTWFVGAGILAILNLLLKPILHILFLPIHVLTLGFFSIVINAAVFFLFLRLVPQASITAWQFPGLTSAYINLPATQIPVIGTLFVASLIISLITNFFAYLVE